MKYKYYVNVVNKRYVTSLGAHRTAFWKAGEPALAMSQTKAKDVCEGLCMNFIPAMVVMAPDWIELKNEEEPWYEEKWTLDDVRNNWPDGVEMTENRVRQAAKEIGDTWEQGRDYSDYNEAIEEMIREMNENKEFDDEE